jgi:predicted TIM-barrel fold metal-dependent hydrolase
MLGGGVVWARPNAQGTLGIIAINMGRECKTAVAPLKDGSTLGGSVAGAILLAAVVSAPAAVRSQPVRDHVFTDAHVHLNDPEAWIRLMDDAGIARAVVLRGRDIDNQELLAAGQRWPERLLPFLSVSPEHREHRGRWEADDPTLVETVESLLEAGGFYGIGEISVSHFPGRGFPEADFDPRGRVMRGILAAARRYAVPVLVHVEVTRLKELAEVLEDFRDVTVIWAHGGYTPLVLAERMLAQHPNLVYELSARTWQRHPRSPDYTILRNDSDVWPEWIALIEQQPDRFVIGTDASLRSLASDAQKITSVWGLLDQLDPQVRRKVAGENLDRILGIGN